MATTKNTKAANSDGLITIELVDKRVKFHQPMLTIKAETVMEITPNNLQQFKDTIQRQLDAKEDIFRQTEETRLVLLQPKVKLDENDEPILDQSGRPQVEGFDLDDQRVRNRILDAIEAQTSKNKKEERKIKFKLSPEDTKYLAKLILRHCKQYTVVGGHIIDFHDYMADKLGEAEAALAKDS